MPPENIRPPFVKDGHRIIGLIAKSIRLRMFICRLFLCPAPSKGNGFPWGGGS